jgi:hypothetical protein
MNRTVTILKLTAAVLAFVMCLALVITLGLLLEQNLLAGVSFDLYSNSELFCVYLPELYLTGEGSLAEEGDGILLSDILKSIVGFVAAGMAAALVGVVANSLQLAMADCADTKTQKVSKKKGANVTLEEAKEMLEVGAISQEEYEAFRAKVIKEKLGI